MSGLELLGLGVACFVTGLILGFLFPEKEPKRAQPRGAYGLPLCQCPRPKDVIPLGGRRWSGWCGHCGKDLEAKP